MTYPQGSRRFLCGDERGPSLFILTSESDSEDRKSSKQQKPQIPICLCLLPRRTFLTKIQSPTDKPEGVTCLLNGFVYLDFWHLMWPFSSSHTSETLDLEHSDDAT